jgi:hypothetical protein
MDDSNTLRQALAAVDNALNEDADWGPPARPPILLKRPTVDDVKAAAVKHDEGKLPWELLPYDALEMVVRALAVGQDEYNPRNWERGIDTGRTFGSVMRHVTAWWRGRDIDPKTNLPHLACGIAQMLFLLASELRKSGVDARKNHTETLPE